MDDNNRNLILAMVLSALVMIGWYTFFAPTPPVPEQPAGVATDGTLPTTAPPPAAGNSTPAATPAPDSTDPSATAARVQIDSPSLRGSISLAGGRLDDLELTAYRETMDPNSPFVRLLTPTVTQQLQQVATPGTPTGPTELVAQKPYYAVYGWTPGPGVDPALVPGPATIWSVEAGDTLAPGAPVTLRWDNGAGQIFRRTYALDDRYMFTVTQALENTAATPFSAAPYGIIVRIGHNAGPSFMVLHEGAVGVADGKLIQDTYKNITKLDPVAAEGQAELHQVASNGWIGFTDKYWMATMIPSPGQPFTSVVKYAPGDIYQTEARLPMMTAAPGASVEVTGRLFAGAKEWQTIKDYESEYKLDRFIDSIDWGWFYFLTKPIFRVLHWLHGLIGNMGFAIIALTFVLKLIVFPLARKSYVSMAKMRELQPQMEAIKERTGDDKMKYQQEVMALYKKERVNPAAGCLPMLLQIPIFFSLYKVIFVTLELRHAPWIGWIKDLSAPDPSSLLNLFGLLPFSPPGAGSFLHSFSLPFLAIVLGITMWIQQKLNPEPTDPAQKMIFAWMPWIFMFMLGGFASGLVLYWITNNFITIVQQYVIMSMHGHPPNLFGNIRSSLSFGKRKS